MKVRELMRFSRKYLSGRRTAVLMICMLPLGAELIFRLAEAVIYSMLLYYGYMQPMDILTGSVGIQLAAWSLFTLIRWLVCAPLYYAAAVRLSEICRERKNFTPLSSIILGRRSFRRCAGAVLLTKLIGIIFSLPVIISAVWAYRLIERDRLFLALHALAAAVFSLYIYLCVRMNLSAVPFIMAEYRDKGIFRIVFGSFGLLKKRKRILLKLIFAYGAVMLTVIAVPYILPEFMTAFSLSISIFIREDEYFEGNSILSRDGKAREARKIPHEKRRFKAAADKA
ncbi:MAG: hypothetical protein IJ666_00640 [Ruminococcus sp.]|nr:hypothetical protein [Ruminococcus sp.]